MRCGVVTGMKRPIQLAHVPLLSFRTETRDFEPTSKPGDLDSSIPLFHRVSQDRVLKCGRTDRPLEHTALPSPISSSPRIIFTSYRSVISPNHDFPNRVFYIISLPIVYGCCSALRSQQLQTTYLPRSFPLSAPTLVLNKNHHRC